MHASGTRENSGVNLRTAAHLGLITSLGSLLVLVVSGLTEEVRSENRRAAARSGLMELVHTQLPAGIDLDLRRLGESVALCDTHGVRQSVLIPGLASGYAGEMQFVAAVDSSGHVTGVRVLAHSETPGIGDVVEAGKSPWIHGLAGRERATTRWALSRDGGDIDGVTGATITLRGLLHGVREHLADNLPECAA